MKISALQLLAAVAAAGTVVTAALSIEKKEGSLPTPEKAVPAAADASAAEPHPFYNEGDWFKYALLPSYSLPGAKKRVLLEDSSFESDSFLKFSAGYGHSFFTSSKYHLYDGDQAVSNVIQSGAAASNEIRLLVQGHVGKRLTVYIDHDSDRDLQEQNTYLMQYRAVDDDEVIREINAGDIDVKADKSKFAFFDSAGRKSIGVDSTVRKGNLTVKGFISVAKGSDETETFKGNSSSANSSVADYQYLRNTYFQLEPYLRYDGITDASLSFPAAYTSLVTFTSAPADPSSYMPKAVNLDPTSVEIWIDPQTTVADVNAVTFAPDGGSYLKLTQGTDYKVNFVTGEITFLRAIAAKSRIIAGYRLAGGAASSDPAVRTDLITGKNAVYIKFGTSIEEDPDHDGTTNGDVNNDGKVNHDVYEIKSRYVIGDKKLRPENFTMTLYNGTKVALSSDRVKLGRYTTDYSSGMISYYLREPFRPLLGASAAAQIYSQTAADLYEVSKYSQKFGYIKDARSFQLKHMDIVAGSVTVLVNGSALSPSLFNVNNLSGSVELIDANNPVVVDSTVIVIRYQYAQSDLSTKGFLAGLRGDYRVNEMLSAGGSFLYGRSNATDIVPQQGSEPTQNVVFEGDTTVNAGPSKFGKLASAVTDGAIDTVPLSFSGYAEYAHSIYDVNTFGKMLVDDMESDTEEASLTLSERDWILSSMPSGILQSQRAELLYKYYRDLNSPSTLQTLGFSPHVIPYTTKAGPYNVCEGHLSYSDSDKNSSRRSLVFDADFSTGAYAAAATRINNGSETDLSSLQYVEVWYRSAGGSGSVSLSLDLGQINEDADGTGSLKTEDLNSNGYLDRDISNNIDEDIGYAFSPSGHPSTRVGGGPYLNSETKGDGTLTSEDLNWNGTLDTTEKTISFPGSYAWKDSDTTAYSALTVDLADTTWKKTRIYLKRNTLTENELYKLRHVTSLRLVMQQNSTTSKATVFIDSLRIVSSRWKDVYINGVSNEDTTKMKVNLVDTWNDAEYRTNSFMTQQRSEYTSLYGDRTDSDINDEKESALSLAYALSGGYASVSRHFAKTLDLRRYHTMSLWLNPRSYAAGDFLRIYLCTSSSDYTWYDIPLNWDLMWRKISLKLDNGSKGDVAVSGTSGVPDRGQITMMKAEVHGSAGRLWIDTILAADPYTLTGDAYWCEGNVKVTRPLYITDGGTAVARDLSVGVVRKYHSGDYNSPGRTDLGMSDDDNELKTSVELLPGWKNAFGASFRKTRVDSFDPSYTDSDRGRASRDAYSFSSEYRKNDPYAPCILVSYNGENYSKARDEYISDSRVTENTDRKTHSPSISYEQSIADWFNGIWKIRTVLDNTYYSETVRNRTSEGAALSDSDVAARTHEAWQKNSLSCLLDYTAGPLFFSPQYKIYEHEVVSYSTTGTMTGSILSGVDGSFHFPFETGRECRNVQRTNEYSFLWGLRNIPSCGFNDSWSFAYDQNAFNDYTEAEKSVYSGFARNHSAASLSSRTITVPFLFNEPLFTVLRSTTLTWSRKMYFTESGVPYEGEGSDFYGEHYGIKRSFAGTVPETTDLWNYTPWHFFAGRGTCANARDHINGRLNAPVSIGGSSVGEYCNALKLVENAGLTNSFVFRGVSLNTGVSANDVCGRESVSALPGQQLTLSANGDIGVNLMDIFSFGFFRPNGGRMPVHSSRYTLGYTFTRTMLFTSNIVENSHQPSTGISFQWGMSTLSTSFGMDFRRRENHDFISSDPSKRSPSDDVYYAAMSHDKINELSIGYQFKIRYETDITPLYRFFMQFYQLTGVPMFSLEYSLLLNRYDYLYSVSPEPYDQHLVTGKLSFDLHKNVRGGITAQMALERWYNRETHGLYREVASYDIGFNVTVLF